MRRGGKRAIGGRGKKEGNNGLGKGGGWGVGKGKNGCKMGELV